MSKSYSNLMTQSKNQNMLYTLIIYMVMQGLWVLLWRLTTLPETRIRTKKNTVPIRIHSITLVKNIYWIQHNKEQMQKNGEKKMIKAF